MSDTVVPSTARSTLAIDWDSETRNLYYDEQEAEVGHWGLWPICVLVSAPEYINIPLTVWTRV